MTDLEAIMHDFLARCEGCGSFTEEDLVLVKDLLLCHECEESPPPLHMSPKWQD